MDKHIDALLELRLGCRFDSAWSQKAAAQVAALDAAIALMRGQSEPVAWIAPSSLESLHICRKDEHNGFVEVWMRQDDERTIPLYIATPKDPADEQ